jgi:hypothetical protein
MTEIECQQDALCRIQRWLDLLECRLVEMLRASDPELLKPNEREQAISRNLVLVLRFLQLRQQQARPLSPGNEQALLEELLQNLEE